MLRSTRSRLAATASLLSTEWLAERDRNLLDPASIAVVVVEPAAGLASTDNRTHVPVNPQEAVQRLVAFHLARAQNGALQAVLEAVALLSALTLVWRTLLAEGASPLRPRHEPGLQSNVRPTPHDSTSAKR